MDNRRSNPRFERRVDVEVDVAGTSSQGVTRDLSLGGLCVRLDGALPFGQKVRLRFRLPTQAEPVEVEGEVRWSETQPEGDTLHGIRFLGLRARDVWALNKFLQSPPASE